MTHKIGILHGMESSFPEAFVERVNEKKEKGIIAEQVIIDKVVQGEEHPPPLVRRRRKLRLKNRPNKGAQPFGTRKRPETKAKRQD